MNRNRVVSSTYSAEHCTIISSRSSNSKIELSGTADALRLRPVLMTSFCTAFGALPLMIATGAGAESRQAIGVVVFYGVLISVFLTLGVVPAVYTLVARNTRPPAATARCT